MNRFDLNLSDATPSLDCRFFTLAEANRAVTLVKRIVADIVSSYARLIDLQEQIDSAQRNLEFADADRAQSELVTVAERIQTCAEELDDIGVQLRDWSLGIVDFPCIADGREVYLCWRHGDDQVRHWHEADSGSEGRQSIESLPCDAALNVR